MVLVRLSGCLFIDRGIANSVCVIDGPLDYIYCVDALYQDRDRADDVAISLFDPQLQIDWPLAKADMIISKRDSHARNLKGEGS
jgi:dTDP-4-dehydrorhamnose 3,5-epimerase-like enzyme